MRWRFMASNSASGLRRLMSGDEVHPQFLVGPADVIGKAQVEFVAVADFTHHVEERAFVARLAVHDDAVHVEDDCLELSHTKVWTIRGAGSEGTLKAAGGPLRFAGWSSPAPGRGVCSARRWRWSGRRSRAPSGSGPAGRRRRARRAGSVPPSSRWRARRSTELSSAGGQAK